MTVEQKIKFEILREAFENNDITLSLTPITENNIDELYKQLLVEQDLHWDYESDFRGSGIETNIQCSDSRYYESKSVARQLKDGTWIGWTYWYGGGKHAEPEAIDWMSEAYDLDCETDKQMIEVRSFQKTKRIAKLSFSFVLLEQFLKGQQTQQNISTNCPKDLKIISIESPIEMQIGDKFWIYCESKQFPIIHIDDVIPQLKPFWYKAKDDCDGSEKYEVEFYDN